MNGISTVIRNLYENTLYQKDRVTFLFPDQSNSEMVEALRALGYEVVINSDRSANTFRYISFLKRMIRKNGYDIVHVHGSSATNTVELWAAYLAKAPVRIMHSHNTSCKHMFIHRMLKPFVNLFSTHRMACSEEAGHFLFGKKECTVIYNAFDVSRYIFNDGIRRVQRKKLGISDDTVLFGHVGCLNNQKNQIFLIRAFRLAVEKNPLSHLVLIGEGENRPLLEKEIAENQLSANVTLMGNCSNVHEILNAMDCFVFPSLYEGLGIAPIEAQANGLSVLSASDRIPQMIRINENFQFLPLSKGEAAWADAMLRMEKARCVDGAENVRQAGFDITEEATRLHGRYVAMCNRNK